MLTSHIVDWNLTKPDGNKVDFKNVAEMRRVDTFVMNKIIGIVKGDKQTTAEDLKALEEAAKNL